MVYAPFLFHLIFFFIYNSLRPAVIAGFQMIGNLHFKRASLLTFKFCGQRQYENKMKYLEWVFLSHFKYSWKLEPPGKWLAVLFKKTWSRWPQVASFLWVTPVFLPAVWWTGKHPWLGYSQELLTVAEWLWVNLNAIEINREKLSWKTGVIPK